MTTSSTTGNSCNNSSCSSSCNSSCNCIHANNDGTAIATVLAAFRTTPLTAFRKQLQESLRRQLLLLLATMTTTTNNNNHNPLAFSMASLDSLASTLDWKKLCQEHDTYTVTTTTNNNNDPVVAPTTTTTTTALSELLAAVQNPVVVPQCVYQRTVVPILIQALIQSPRAATATTTAATAFNNNNNNNRWTPSQQLLLQAVSGYGQEIYQYVSKHTTTTTTTATTTFTTTMTPNHANRLLSSIYHWISSLPVSSSSLSKMEITNSAFCYYYLAMAGIVLVRNLDDWDLLLLMQKQQQQQDHRQKQQQQQQQHEGSASCTCHLINDEIEKRPITSVAQPPQLRLRNMEDLHDGSTDIHYNTTNTKKTRQLQHRYHHRFWQTSSSSRVSVKDIMNAPSSTLKQGRRGGGRRCCESCSPNRDPIEESNGTTTVLVKDWSTVRTRAYKKFLGLVVQQQHQHSSRRTSTINNITNMPLAASAAATAHHHLHDQHSLQVLPISPFSPLDTTGLLQQIAQRPESPSLRVCLLLLSHSSSSSYSSSADHHINNHNAYFRIAQQCWQMYKKYESSSSSAAGASAAGSGIGNNNNSSTAIVWLRLYTEWLSDCRAFEPEATTTTASVTNTRKRLWHALLPLRKAIEEAATSSSLLSEEESKDVLDDDNDHNNSEHEEQHDDDTASVVVVDCDDSSSSGCEITAEDDDDDDIATGQREKENCELLLHCFGYIWTKRSHLFRSSTADSHEKQVQREVQAFTNLLSIHFGEHESSWLQWYHPNDPMADMVLATLQRWKILGVTTAMEDELSVPPPHGQQPSVSVKEDSSGMRLEVLSSWPFHPTFSLRNAVGRIESAVLGLDGSGTKDVGRILLSPKHNPIDDTTAPTSDSDKASTTKTTIPAVPILDYICDEEIYCHIFSFCSPKRLGKLQQVCQLWNVTIESRSESVWKEAYVARFGPYKIVPTLPTQTETISVVVDPAAEKPWKDLFYHKDIAEKAIRRQKNAKTGFKYHTCPYVGCLFVIKSEKLQKQHLAKHEREQKRKKKNIGNKKQKTKASTATTSKKRKRQTAKQSGDKINSKRRSKPSATTPASEAPAKAASSGNAAAATAVVATN